MDAPGTGTVPVADTGADGHAGLATGLPPRAGTTASRPAPGAPHQGAGVPVRSEAGAAERFSPGIRAVIGVLVVAVLAVALVLRFWTRSDLWLDEALTVNIAKLPLHDLPAYLKRDGAPPLFYALLHFWMGIFGTSDLAVRSLSGVIGVATVPLAWVAGRRLGGRKVAWAAMLLVATSPFAVRYDTETRMYALVALETVLGFLALDRALRRPRPGNLVAVAVVTALLLYTHYWSIYLVAVVLCWLGYQAWRGREVWRRTARAAFCAVVVGGLAFLPWAGIFVYQSQHTGTPWATPANFAAMVNAITSFAGGPTNQGRALALLYFALCGLALFGLAVDKRHIDLDLRTRPVGRPLAIVVAGTLAVAIAGGFVSKSAFDARYASVVFVPLVLLVAVGFATFQSLRVRSGVLALALVAGLASGIPNVTTNRTQAGAVAAAIGSHAQAGDVVAYCPDQLGPAVERLLPAGRYPQLTFPRGTGPVFVNWVDYGTASKKGSPVGFATRLEQMAGPDHQIFVVWDSGYQTFGTRCEQIIQQLSASTDLVRRDLVTAKPLKYYQPMYLSQFSPSNP